jgi:transposase InsO family protein
MCHVCNTYHRGKLPRTAPLQPIPVGAPFERLSIDLTGPHCRSDRGHVWILTCIDPFTKWVEAFPLRNKEAETVAKVLVEQVFTRFGIPIALLSDKGKEVDGNIMKAVCRMLDIDKLHTTAYKASTNAAIERFHKTMNSMLGKFIEEHQRDWDSRLPFVMAAYRASKHDSTGYSPNLLTLGRETRAPVDIVFDLPDPDGTNETYDGYVEKLESKMREAYKFVRGELGQAAERNKRYYDLRVRPRKYEVGDWVYYFNPRTFRGRQDKWSRKYSGPFLVVAVTSPVNVTLQKSKNAKTFVTHIDKVKPYLADHPLSWLKTSELPQISAADKEVEQPVVTSEPARLTEEDIDEEISEVEMLDSQPLPSSQRSSEPLGTEETNGKGNDRSEESQSMDYAVDEGPQPRPRRETRRPAKFNDYV